jgi:uncharacterized protein (TIGR03083 family)
MSDDLFERTAANRRRIADTVEALDPSCYDAPTLCAGWTVHHLTAHLLQPFAVGFWGFFRASLRHRGDTDATVDAIARRVAREHSVAEIVALLREHADERVDPPRVGPMGPFADHCLHLRDLARPLGLDVDVPLADWRTLLDYLASSQPAPALMPRGRLDGLALRATDQDWTSGDGDEVAGPSEALAMAATGRTVALDDLAGTGVTVLAERIRRT